MPDHLVCPSSALAGDGVRIVMAGTVEVGVYRHKGALYAYKNTCVHQGGPVCEGKLMPRVLERLDADGGFQQHDFDEADMHIVCPWHGYEFRLLTGECAVAPTLRLKRYDVFEAEGGIYVRTPD